MHESATAPLPHDVFAADEIAQAAGVEVEAVLEALAAGYVTSYRGFVATADALLLVRVLGEGGATARREQVPISLLADRKRHGGVGLLASGALHAMAVILLLVVTSLGLMDATPTEVPLKDPIPLKLVFMMSPGPGGGGGGGGLKMPAPPPRAQRKPLVKLIKRTPSPVPPVRRRPAPPPPRPIPRRPPPPIEPPPQRVEPVRVEVEPPKPVVPPAVQAPVVPVPTDPVDMPGLIESRKQAAAASAGPGTGGGVGTGAGTGVGEGTGAGIGPGQGGGTGGGPYQPGSGISPPTLVREVKPSYTDEARRRAVEGDVVLEIVVRRDGTVGDIRVKRSLGAGLEQRAIDAVRQWRFGPARRQGSPVDVVVEVSVEFKLR
jgi:TonB family protein